MIADEIKKAGQATIDQSTDLLTYRLTDTWTSYSGTHSVLAALACDTGGSYWHDDDNGEWTITFTQDVCRYNGTPVKKYAYYDHESGDYQSYELYDFNNNRIYYSESGAPADSNFTVRQIEFQNNKQSFQLLSSEHPTYTDTYNDETYYSESYLLNTQAVPSKSSATGDVYRALTTVTSNTRKTLQTVYAYSNYVLYMIDAVTSSDYNWNGASYPTASCSLILTLNDGRNRYVQFDYYNPGNAMIMLRPGQSMKIELWFSSATSGISTTVLTTVGRISL